LAHPTCRVHERLKRIKARVCLQYLDRSCGLACKRQDCSVSIIGEIGIKREGALEFGYGGVVLALEKQHVPERSASFWQAGVEAHSRLRQFKSAYGVELAGVDFDTMLAGGSFGRTLVKL